MIRERTEADLPSLVQVLLAQRPESGYPVSLPPDPADLIAREHEHGAWVWEADGRALGHVSVTGFGEVAELTDAEREEGTSYARAHGCEIAELGVISALFIDLSLRGQGVGKALFQHAVDHALARGLRPCLDVVVTHASALAMYEHLGWQTVDEITPDWLPEGMGPVVTMIWPQPS